ncbi:hypothetical protein M440DRAFT_1326683 [Trichoderma longibrachiatum ATCC 18648]|uniref:Protection of telomeres protein 1 n=1 Tax=Trichoderma longibrachiatum ATCC 18648 TaxID=983965 RepID=A0A2T4CDW8_TRILO|nr:hypothetical protein M440DRAFT_1326683 [Trichoderma longibrachiatum ATCC 18648]
MAPHGNKRQTSLPSGFITVRDILDRKRGVGNLLNVIGVVKEFTLPAPSRGTDWKCRIKLFDRSVEDGSFDSVTFNIFRPEHEMPNPSVGDVIVLYQAKLQLYANELSLMTHRTTDIHLYSSSEIPQPPEGALKALRPLSRKTAHSPGQVVHEYVSHLYHSIDKSSLPTEAEVQVMKARSAINTNKSKELKDVRDGTFVDVVVQLVRQPFDTGDRVTMWVSDYTENEHFFHFTYKGLDVLQGQDSYMSPISYGAGAGAGAGGEWKGPFGKRSMQVTCYDPHTSIIREQGLSAGSWVLLRNLQIKYGRNGANLEGFLREDRGSSSQKINIQQMDATDTDAPDPRLKEAIRRKRDYEREKKDRLKDLSDAAVAGQKRKSQLAEIEPASSNKSKNSKKRKQGNKKTTGQNVPSAVPATASAPTTLSHVKCENEHKAISTIDSILEPVYLETDINGQQVKLRLPFVNMNYRAHVRVVNFMPPDLEDFARPRRATEYDMLSDNEEPDHDDFDSGGESTADDSTSRVWEWRFFLELEDASPSADNQGKRKTIWVAVNNFSAQCLVNMDASDLRKNQHELETLRHRLSLLWGELEEKKTLERENRRRAALANRGANQPPSHSSDDERGSAQMQQVGRASQVRTRPFACCIHQYGVEIPEEDPRRADAGEGKRWQRLFGLFGTRIAYD